MSGIHITEEDRLFIVHCTTLYAILMSTVSFCSLLYRLPEARAAPFWIAEQIVCLVERYPNLWFILIVILPWTASLAFLPEARETREAAIWIMDRVTRLKEYLAATFQDDTTEAERQWSPYIGVKMLGFLLGMFSVLEEWVRAPVLCMLFVGPVFCAFPRSWRVWTYETVHDYVAYPLMRLGLVSLIVEDETPSEADSSCREDLEDTDEELTDSEAIYWEGVEDASDEDDTDDSWSLDLDTPSETESSQSNDTSNNSTDSIPTGPSVSIEASVREAIDDCSKQEDAASYLDCFILLPSALNPQERSSNAMDRPDWFTINRLTVESSEPRKKTTQLPQISNSTREQILKSVIRDNSVAYQRMLESRPADPDPSILTSCVALKPEHQPTDMIVLQIEILKGTDFQEKIMVRMHKTTPFVQLKEKLRKKDDNESALVVGDPRGCYPVFDHETPLSIGSQHLDTLTWGNMPDMPKLLDISGKDRVKSVA